jgi:Ca2+-binding EF-hand superfamily protein
MRICVHRFFDRQSNGKLTQQEFFDACWQLGVRLTKTETMALYGGYDKDRDGVLNYYEFLHNVLQEKEIDQV